MVVGRTNGHARSLRREATEVEKRLWQRLRNRQLSGFKSRRQATIGPYIADFLCAEQRLIVELDGGQHDPYRDGARTDWLIQSGYRVVRFWNLDVIENENGVLTAILEVLEKEDPTSPNQFGVNIAPRCLGLAGGKTGSKLTPAGEG